MNMRAQVLFVAVTSLLVASVSAQQPPAGREAGPPPTARTAAPIDLTGQWVSVVTEDWRWRMVTPAKGDTISIPINAEGQQAADAWDYVRDMAAGNQCRAYGAGGIMRMPTRLRITWQDDHTLKIETDAGQQTKWLHFDRTRQAGGARMLQGHSVAEWIDVAAAGRGGGRGGGGGGRGGVGTGTGTPAFGTGGMKVITTHLRDGYLRKNGVPYSQNAIVTEYFDRVPGPDNAQWLIVKTIVEDPTYLAQPYITSAHFMLEPDGSKWRPTPCEIDPPLAPPEPERP